ncbi:MAG TPA: DUF559 domain-containing protein [Limnochordia bacterium]
MEPVFTRGLRDLERELSFSGIDERAVGAIVQHIVTMADGWWHFLIQCDNSPVEHIMAAYLIRNGLWHKCIPQFEVAGYRVDFALVIRDFKIAIECDGYTYHGSREAYSYDRARDRVLEREGWRVFRFTAGEILANPQACVDEIKDFIMAHEPQFLDRSTA